MLDTTTVSSLYNRLEEARHGAKPSSL